MGPTSRARPAGPGRTARPDRMAQERMTELWARRPLEADKAYYSANVGLNDASLI